MTMTTTWVQRGTANIGSIDNPNRLRFVGSVDGVERMLVIKSTERGRGWIVSLLSDIGTTVAGLSRLKSAKVARDAAERLFADYIAAEVERPGCSRLFCGRDSWSPTT
jgi:hypothetical protein